MGNMVALNEGRYLHLTSGEPSAVRAALKILGRTETVIGFPDTLAEGPIHDVDAGAAARIEWWSRVEGKRLPTRETRRLDDASAWARVEADRHDVVLWHGPAAPERLFALRACWRLRRQPRRVHEVKLRGHPFKQDLPRFFGAVGIVGPQFLAAAWRSRARVRDVAARGRQWTRFRSRRGDLLW